MNVRELERKLSRRSYEELDNDMAAFDDAVLLELLDSRSIKVGDTAASLLSRRGKTNAIVDSVLAGHVSTKVGKIRAINILSSAGTSCVRAREAYLSLLYDKNHDVVDSALFGLVFLQDRRSIGAIRDAMATQTEGSETHARCLTAIEALQQQDPFIFSPYYHDAGDVWGLDKQRFGDRIGW
ncbi:MAG: hypothetical protein DWQ29_02220 [Planctomycetota bacterium]|nr:MAG: hypothetical protein DWQ29_02220 [Planctomycetota bacterium]